MNVSDDAGLLTILRLKPTSVTSGVRYRRVFGVFFDDDVSTFLAADFERHSLTIWSLTPDVSSSVR